MLTLSPSTVILIMALLLFALGLITFVVGVLILALRTSNQDVQTLATQTTRLAQKGMAEDMAGLVGNASTLIESMNQLVRTATGVGFFLTVVGLLMMALSSWLALQVFVMNQ